MKERKSDNQGKISYIFTKETFGVTLMLFSFIVMVMLLTWNTVFAGIGSAVCTLLYGTFGYGSLFLICLTAYLGELLTFEKKLKISLKKKLTLSLTVVMLFLLFHAVTTRDYSLDNYGAYISECYMNAQNGFAGYTFGGVISAIIVYPVAKTGGFVTAYVLFSVLTVACGYLAFLSFKRGGKAVKEKEEVKDSVSAQQHTVAAPVREQSAVSVHPHDTAESLKSQSEEPVSQEGKYSVKNLGRKILFENGEFAAESYRRNMIFNESSYFSNPTVSSEEDYLRSFSANDKPSENKQKTYTESYREEIYGNSAGAMPPSYVYGDRPVENLVQPAQEPVVYHEQLPKSDPYDQSAVNPYDVAGVDPYGMVDYGSDAEETYPSYEKEQDEQPVYEEPIAPPVRERVSGFSEERRAPEIAREEPSINRAEPETAQPRDDVYDFLSGQQSRTESVSRRGERSNAELFDTDEKEEETENGILSSARGEQTSANGLRETVNRVERERVSPQPAPIPETKPEKPKHVWKRYERPTLDLLDDYPENANVNTGEIEDNKRTIVETLERFKIASQVANVTIGPSITRYDVIIEDKTNIKRSLGYRDAIAMELRKDNVNAYLNYTKGALSIEVPNNRRAIVGLKTMLASQSFINSKPSSLTFALGKNVEGEVVCPDITKMPHLLVAGTTGSGKSICLNALLVSLLYKYGPEELRLILVDPKQVEFISYDKLPHLMINEIIYDCDKAIKALNWAIKEMERRYSLFKEMSEAGMATNNLDAYNSHLPQGEEKLPKIVIILDEFGDLMLQAKKDIESRIIKLVQKARACGIHLILATQRPSVDCITGLIKSNLPTRIGFKVNSFDDARVIFDIGGAEKLLGKGDSYFRSAIDPELNRIQCCFVDSPEVQKVTDYVKQHNETYFDDSVSDFINKVEEEPTANTSMVGDGAEDVETKIDDTFIKALKYCVTSNQASVSMIQRRFPVGYIKACKIIDWMENMNYITPSEGSKPRKVLLSKDEFINIFGDVDD